jgi:hypothetical protein
VIYLGVAPPSLIFVRPLVSPLVYLSPSSTSQSHSRTIALLRPTTTITMAARRTQGTTGALSTLAVVLLVCVSMAKAICLDNGLSTSSVNYVQICWNDPTTSPPSTAITFTKLTYVDGNLANWPNDLTSYGGAVVAAVSPRRSYHMDTDYSGVATTHDSYA